MSREQFTFLATADETDGELLCCELVVAPGGGISMPHVHPHQEERWEIVGGQARFRLGSEERLAGPGETVVAEPGAPHAFSNAGHVDLSMILELRPALRTDELFAAMCELAARDAFDAKGRLRPLQAMAIGREFRDEAALPHVPRAVQRALLGLAGPVLRLAGYGRGPLRSAG